MSQHAPHHPHRAAGRQFLICLSAFLLATQPVSADQVLNILLSDGTQVTCLLSDNPQITLEGNTLKLLSASRNSSWTFNEVEGWKFTDTTGIQNLLADNEDGTSVVVANGTVTISHCNGKPANIYNTNGQLLAQFAAQGDQIQIHLSDLEKGTVIIKVGKKAFKLTNR